MVRRDNEIARLAEAFVLARVTNMRGVDLNHFVFDYDLTWAGFFLDGDGRVLGRYGGRDADSSDKYLTVEGLKYALREALSVARAGVGNPQAPVRPGRFVEDYSSASRLRPNACIHCHHVYEYRREEMKRRRTWTLDDVWVFPTPETVGLTVDPKQGNKVQAIRSGSPADRAGLRPGDILRGIQGDRIASFADIQYSLHNAPIKGSITVRWDRAEMPVTAELTLPERWRRTDISWRQSMWTLSPQAGVVGTDLEGEEKKRLGIAEAKVAFRQGPFVAPAARLAGIRPGDIILGIPGQTEGMTMAQFNAHVRVHYHAGDRVLYQVLREGERLVLPITLPHDP